LYNNLAEECNDAFFSNYSGRDKYFLTSGRYFICLQFKNSKSIQTNHKLKIVLK